MATDADVKALIEARSQALRRASEGRDADGVAAWYSNDAVFEAPVHGQKVVGVENLRKFYAQIYAAIPTFRITSSKSTDHSAEFVAIEMTCEGISAFAMPGTAVKEGDKFEMVGVSLYWWKWEGPGEQWNGNLSEEGIKGWKIVRESAYMSTK